MREIKFRALSRGGHWHYGELNRHDLEMSGTHHAIRYFWEYFAHWRRETLGEYTGRMDKNGVEIYESDLVKPPHDRERVYEVYWDERDSSWRLRIHGEMQYDKTTALMFAHLGEVIGNSYENPELLEGQPCQTSDS